jgi:hypothetical protein
MPVETIRPKLLLGVQTVHSLTELLQIAEGFPDCSLRVGSNRVLMALATTPIASSGDTGDADRAAPGSPRPPDSPRVVCPFPPSAHWRHAARSQGQERFETDVALPEGAEVVHVSEPLTTMEAEVSQPHSTRRYPTTAIFLAMDGETVEMLVTPGKQDLQDRMEVCQGRLAGYQHPPPDERTDAPQDDAELVDAERCRRGSHALRVARRIVSLKGSPRYLALS